MEEDIKRFFNRIIISVSMVLIWLLFTLGLGIYNNWLIPAKKWEWTNFVFYVIALSTLALIIRKLIIFWREKFPHG